MIGHIIKFSKEQSDLLRAAALQITLENGDTYFHLPFFYKDLGNNEYEVLKKDQLPDDIKDLINPYQL